MNNSHPYLVAYFRQNTSDEWNFTHAESFEDETTAKTTIKKFNDNLGPYSKAQMYIRRPYED